MDVEIFPSLAEHEPILANLLELYSYDFSEFIKLELGADGRFGYEHLSLYWKEPGRYPFFIKVNGHLAGFVLVQKGSQVSSDDDVWDIAEFFIIRGERRRGVGTQAAHKIWKQFFGKWEVRVTDRNQKAKVFWARAISEFVGQTVMLTSFKKNGANWHLFSFESKSGA